MTAPANQTAMAALAQCARILEASGEEAPPHTFAIRRAGPDAESTINAFVAQSGFPLPADLIAFYLAHGGVSIGRDFGQVLRLFGATQLLADTNATGARHPPRHGLLDFIAHSWGGRPEFDEAFSAEQALRLNRHYLVIGLDEVAPDTRRYLYIDREGRCGVLFYNQDYFEEEHLDDMLKMLGESPAKLSFNDMFTAEILAKIELIRTRTRNC